MKISIGSATKGTFIFTAVTVLSGCVAYPNVEKINADFNGYLNSEYSISYPSAALRAKLTEVNLKPKPEIKDFSMKMNLSQAGIGEQTPKVSPFDVRFTNLGNGFYREVRELRNNDFLTARFVYLTWAGLLQLRSDTIISGDTFPVPYQEVKDVAQFKFDPANMKVGDKLVFETKLGNRPQAFNFITEKSECIAEKIAPAASLQKNFSGNGVWLACTTKNDRGFDSKKKSVYLIDYALAIPLEFKSPTRTQEYEITGFTAQ
ncbi:hypothetical protein GmRootV118_17370 [Variovorax sp. V118]|uniref:hypothetical protein n=1 Tax=Variovorax sp. V118 TaxID=3065954 RepID=UPI0034E89FCE